MSHVPPPTRIDANASIHPEDVRPRLGRHVLADGLHMVMDPLESQGSWLVDARNGDRYLDMFSFYGANALGMNHPALTAPDVVEELGRIAVNKPPNSGVYTTAFAEFVETFSDTVGDPALPHLFFIEGGALAVENALKVAFDWKSRRNENAGRSPELGTRVMHMTHAFHGRTGYTTSLTNSAAVKIARFPKFDWPRLPTPAVHHFDTEADLKAAEDRAVAIAEHFFNRYAHDIAAYVVEPIQAEGGDNHLRPEFLRRMQDLCHRHEALFILDEVQTGCGLTGSTWAYQQLALEPDIVCFGKKFQVCGLMAGRRVDDEPNNAFRLSGRIASTWGGNLTDMVRATHILRQIRRDDLVANAAQRGDDLLVMLQKLESRFPDLVSHVRGRGLMCAFDLNDSAARDNVLRYLETEHRVLLLPCGPRSVRFRPNLAVTTDELQAACDAIRSTLEAGVA